MWCIKYMLCIMYIVWMCVCVLYVQCEVNLYMGRSHPWGEKTLGEIWAPVTKAINSILWTSVASRCLLARMGVESGSVYGRTRTMKDLLARCLKKADVQVCTLFHPIYILLCNATSVHLLLSTLCEQQMLSSYHVQLQPTMSSFIPYELWPYNNRSLFYAG